MPISKRQSAVAGSGPWEHYAHKTGSSRLGGISKMKKAKGRMKKKGRYNGSTPKKSRGMGKGRM